MTQRANKAASDGLDVAPVLISRARMRRVGEIEGPELVGRGGDPSGIQPKYLALRQEMTTRFSGLVAA